MKAFPLGEEAGAQRRSRASARCASLSLAGARVLAGWRLRLRGPYHRRYITEFLDSVFKRGEAGIMHQSKGSARRFSMGSHLLEVLLQIAVLRTSGTGFYTQELRIDELLAFLQERYGIYIDRLPPGDGFNAASINDLAALRRNAESFKGRLREIGFFRDLSDAYVTQTITPRYAIAASSGGA